MSNKKIKKHNKHNKLSAAIDMLKNYKYKSVFFEYWRLIILGFLIVFLLVVFLVSNYKSTQYYNDISSMLSKNMYNARNALDSVFAEIIRNEKKMSENIAPFKIEPGAELSSDAVDGLEKALNNVLEYSDLIKSIYLYCPEKEYVVSSSKIYKSSKREEFADISWFDTYYEGNSEVFLRSHPKDAVFGNCISVCRKTESRNLGELLVIYNIKYDKINFAKYMGTFNDYEINVINNDGMVIYSTNIDKVSHNTEEYKTLNKMLCMSESDVNNVKTYISSDSLLESIQTRNVKTTIITEIQKKELRNMNTNLHSTVNMVAVAIIILLIISIFMAIKFYSVIAGLFYKISNKYESEEEKEKNNNGIISNEIDEIDTHISDILENKSKTESKLADSIMQLQRSQSIALQSQFSPHFLFNTLQLINSIAFVEIGHDNRITDAVSILCDILHAAMDTTEYTCSFKDELELAEKYVKLQNMKYEDAFEVGFDISEETLGLRVAKLSLQPVLENSMHHGYGYDQEKLKIVIHSHIENDKLIIAVEDDGVGMTEERQEEVIRNLENKQIEKKDSIGLLNLNQRIKLIFGYEYGCTIKNNDDKGVTVTMSFPIR
ncbi:MAG: sensor histidine kinase [Monoglobaceae bacterium]